MITGLEMVFLFIAMFVDENGKTQFYQHDPKKVICLASGES